MTAEEIESIIAKHEMQRIELKESFDAECIETACAFANAHGGCIFIGVTDGGEPSKSQLRRESLRDYENKISTATEPSVAVDAEKAEFRGREIVLLRVMENPLKPVAYKGRCFVRRGSVNHQMTPAEIAECHLKITGGSMDAAFVPRATREDIDEDAVRRYMAKAVAERRRSFGPGEKPWDVLKKLDLVMSETEITRAAYLLFAKDPQRAFSQAVIHAGAFKADGAVIYDTLDVRGNIQGQIERTLEFVQKNIRCAIVVTGKAAHDRYWEYPLEAIRETLANAICHRDYSLPFKIEVKVFENRVVVSEPDQNPTRTRPEILDNLPPSCGLVYDAIEKDNRLTYRMMAESLKLNKDTVNTAVQNLIDHRLLRHIGPKKGGHWEIVNQQPPTATPVDATILTPHHLDQRHDADGQVRAIRREENHGNQFDGREL